MNILKKLTYKEKPVSTSINKYTGKQRYPYTYELSQGWYTQDTAALSLGDFISNRIAFLLGHYHMVFLDETSVPESELWPDILALSQLSHQHLTESFVEKMAKYSPGLFDLNAERRLYNEYYNVNVSTEQLLEKSAIHNGFSNTRAYMDKLIMDRQIEPYRNSHEHCSAQIWPMYDYLISWMSLDEDEYFPLFQKWKRAKTCESRKNIELAGDRCTRFAMRHYIEFFDHFNVPYNKQLFLDWMERNAKRLDG